MRFDPGDPASPTAADLVNNLPVSELTQMFAESGERKIASRLARKVVAGRPYSTTGQLADVVSAATPAALRRRGHPATRVFQSLRIAVNEELEQLEDVLPRTITALRPGGRCVAIAYHSGEDRIVKAAFNRAETGGCECPPGLPCACGAVPLGRLVKRRSAQAHSSRGGAQPESRECEDASSRTNRCRSRHGFLMATTVTPRAAPRPCPRSRHTCLSFGWRNSGFRSARCGDRHFESEHCPFYDPASTGCRRPRGAQEVARRRQVGAQAHQTLEGPACSRRAGSLRVEPACSCRGSSNSSPRVR